MDVQIIAAAVHGSEAASRFGGSWGRLLEDVLRLEGKYRARHDRLEVDTQLYLDAVDQADLHITTKRLAYGLANAVWSRKRQGAYAGKWTLAIRSGMNPKTVQRHLPGLTVG